jgi:hypothetical protein
VTRCHSPYGGSPDKSSLLTLSASDVSGLISISRARINQGARKAPHAGSSVTRSPRAIRRFSNANTWRSTWRKCRACTWRRTSDGPRRCVAVVDVCMMFEYKV